jgi:hypothetical protein
MKGHFYSADSSTQKLLIKYNILGIFVTAEDQNAWRLFQKQLR